MWFCPNFHMSWASTPFPCKGGPVRENNLFLIVWRMLVLVLSPAISKISQTRPSNELELGVFSKPLFVMWLITVLKSSRSSLSQGPIKMTNQWGSPTYPEGLSRPNLTPVVSEKTVMDLNIPAVKMGKWAGGHWTWMQIVLGWIPKQDGKERIKPGVKKPVVLGLVPFCHNLYRTGTRLK